MHVVLDDEATERQADRLRAHLARCGDCSELFAQYRRLKAGFVARDVAPPPALQARILEQLRARDDSLHPHRRDASRGVLILLRRAAVAALLVGALSIGLILIGQNETLTASGTVHYEDLFRDRSITADEILPVLIKTDNPEDALKVLWRLEDE